MMKQRFLFFIIVLFLFNSCVEEFELDTDDYEPVIIVNSVFTDDNEIKVFVMQSGSIFSSWGNNLERDPLLDSAFYANIRHEPIKDATVKITNLQNNEEEILYLQDSFFYKTRNILAQKETPYKIEVSTPDFISVSSEATIPKNANITSINYLGYVYTDEYNRPRYKLNINVQDVVDEDNFYEMIIYTKHLDFDINSDPYSDPFYYLYVYTSMRETISNDIVLQENISWTGSSYIFSDNQFANQSHNFEILTNNIYVFDTIANDYISQKPDNYLIELRTISEDYYNYQKQTRKHIDNSYYYSGFDLQTGFSNQYTPISLFSNIENGYGIFSGYSFVRDSIFIDN